YPGNRVDDLDNQVTPDAEFLHHLSHAILRIGHSYQRSLLCEDAWVCGGVHRHTTQFRNNRLRSRRIAHPPPVHGIGFSEGADGNSALFHTRQGREADMTMLVK